MRHLPGHLVRAGRLFSGDAVERQGSSKVLKNVLRDYQPISRIRSRMIPV